MPPRDILLRMGKTTGCLGTRFSHLTPRRAEAGSGMDLKFFNGSNLKGIETMQLGESQAFPSVILLSFPFSS